MIKAVFFNFGGVLAEEGFKEGLKAIGRKNGLDPDKFYNIASELRTFQSSAKSYPFQIDH